MRRTKPTGSPAPATQLCYYRRVPCLEFTVHRDVSASKQLLVTSFGKHFQFVAVKYHTPLLVHKNTDYYSISPPHIQPDLLKRQSSSPQSINITYTVLYVFDTFNFAVTQNNRTIQAQYVGFNKNSFQRRYKKFRKLLQYTYIWLLMPHNYSSILTYGGWGGGSDVTQPFDTRK